MYASKLVCPDCGWETELGNKYACDACGYSLEVVYDYNKVCKNEVASALEHYKTMWDFSMLLPVKNRENIVTLLEGNTPLVESSRIGPALGIHLLFKDETRNPTCSFKDRPNTAGISMAKDFGLDAVTIASTGNAGSSLAAFAAKAGMRCYIFVPEKTPAAKVTQSMAHGATIVKVCGNYSDSYSVANMAAKKYNWANLTSTYLNPYTVEGDKTIAYEIFAQFQGRVPDWIVIPLGAGAMLAGVYKGFVELKQLGFCDKLPRMIGVQAEGCSPITGAFEKGLDVVEAFENPQTIAGGICDPLTGYPQDGTRTLREIRKSGGVGVSVSDTSISAALRELACKEAIFCEPASATSLSAVHTLTERGVIQKGECVVALITAHGLKDIGEIDVNLEEVATISPQVDELEVLMAKLGK